MSEREASLLSGSRGYFSAGDVIPGTKLRIERTLGSGGQGEVHLVVNQVSKQRQVIKLLHPELVRSEAAMARFEKEVQLMAMLDHPNIVKLLHTDVTTESGGRPALPYLLMEHLEGETLAGVYAGRKLTFGRADALHLFSQIAAALDYAASSFGLVHRDLKPANLFFVMDTKGRTSAKVLDFGISQLCEALTSVTSDDFLGTEAYAAPEQYSGRTSPKTDVYQLGIVIWEAFVGHHPFYDRTTRQALMYAQLEAHPPPLSSSIENCPRSLSKLVEAMLDKEPRRRPSMEVVKNTLQDLAKEADLRERERPSETSKTSERRAPEAHPDAADDVFKAKTRVEPIQVVSRESASSEPAQTSARNAPAFALTEPIGPGPSARDAPAPSSASVAPQSAPRESSSVVEDPEPQAHPKRAAKKAHWSTTFLWIAVGVLGATAVGVLAMDVLTRRGEAANAPSPIVQSPVSVLSVPSAPVAAPSPSAPAARVPAPAQAVPAAKVR